MIKPEAVKAYVNTVKQYVHEGALAPEARPILEEQRLQLGLSTEEAHEIEDHVVQFLKRSPNLASAPAPAMPAAPSAAPAPEAQSGYRDRLRQYGQEFLRALRLEFPLSDSLRQSLKQSQQSLELSDSDVTALETKLTESFQNQKATYQAHLQRYEQEFTQAIEAGLPLDISTQDKLTELQTAFRLKSEDVVRVERQVLSRYSLDPDFQSAPEPYPHTAPTKLPTDTAIQVPPTALPQPSASDPATAADRTDADKTGEVPFDPERQQNTVAGLLAGIDAEPIVLQSERNIDYGQLQSLLAAGEWKQADAETRSLMLQAVDRLNQGWLDASSFTEFPCTDLHMIDRLWSHYSSKQFGFSAQWQVYASLEVVGVGAGRLSRANQALALQFCKQVGWWTPRFEFLKYYSALDFTPNAPVGHLPAFWFWSAPWWKSLQLGGVGFGRGGCTVDTLTLSAFMIRLQRCGFEAAIPEQSPRRSLAAQQRRPSDSRR